MFLYTVYPISGVTRKRTARRVDSVSRVNAARPVERSQAVGYTGITPPGQIWEPHKITQSHSQTSERINESGGCQITREESGRERPIGELYIQNTLPLLLEWRRPKNVHDPNYIQKYRDRLCNISTGYNIGERVRQ